MDYTTAIDVWNQIKDTVLTDLKLNLVETGIRYAQIRVEWLLADSEKQAVIGQDRTTCHNSFIVACDVLARNMSKHGENGSWRRRLSDDRKVIGDFACFLHCRLGISAR